MIDCIGDKFIFNGIPKPVSDFSIIFFNDKKPVYEVIRVEEGIPLFIYDYLDRLDNSLKLCNIKRFKRNEITKAINDLISVNNCDSGVVKLLFSTDNFIAYLIEPYKPKPDEYIAGVDTIFLHENRDNPNFKIWNQNFRKLTTNALDSNSVFEAILVNKNGFITEGSRSNTFFVKNDKIFTTPTGLVLPGITRKKVLNICNNIGLEVEMEKIHYTKIDFFDSIFLTGTSRKIVPVKKVGSIMFSVENQLMQTISDEFEKLVVDYIKSKTKK